MRVSRDALLDRINRLKPRVVLMIAGPGWGKTSLARQLLSRALSPSYCDLRDAFDEADADRALDEASAKAPDVLAVDELGTLERVGWAPLERLLRRTGERTQAILLAQRRPEVDL